MQDMPRGSEGSGSYKRVRRFGRGTGPDGGVRLPLHRVLREKSHDTLCMDFVYAVIHRYRVLSATLSRQAGAKRRTALADVGKGGVPSVFVVFCWAALRVCNAGFVNISRVFLSEGLVVLLILRGTISNRTYGTHKKYTIYISLF